MMADDGRQQHVIAAVYHLVKALETDGNTSDDVRKLLEDLDDNLSARVKLIINDAEDKDHRQMEARLASAQHTIHTLHSIHPNIFNTGPTVASEYLQAVSEVEDVITSIENTPLRRGGRSRELVDQAQSTRHIAMTRLQEEAVRILVQNKNCFEQDYPTTPASESQYPRLYEESVVSNDDESANVSRRESSSTEVEEPYTMDLINPDVIPHIRSIADAMFRAGYGHEFRKVFVGFWRGASAEYLTVALNVEQFSIEDILRMEWKYLNWQIKKWCVALRRFVSTYLAGARRLFDQVLGERGPVCLIEASKPSLLRLVNFGQAVSIAPHRPEWLYCLLGMYEVLSDLIPDMDSLLQEEADVSMIRTDFHELVTRLGNSARTIFEEVGIYIASCQSTTPYPYGGIHHLTRYIINYILCIAEYGDTLNSLLPQGKGCENLAEPAGDIPCVVATHLHSWTSILEANLEDKAELYKDTPLKHLFMMNNIRYMVRKISQSKIWPYFGDEWIRSHTVKYRQHAMYYQRATWGSIVLLLQGDGRTGKASLKARCQEFASAFEDVYKNQTRWRVPDDKLREELRILAGKTVIPAYRNFVSKVNSSIGEKYLKYSEQELEAYILDLLEGLPKSLNHLRKK